METRLLWGNELVPESSVSKSKVSESQVSEFIVSEPSEPSKPAVSLGSITSYAQETVYRALQETLRPLGGMTHYVKAGERILLKPNLILRKKPEEAVTTHPAIVEAVARLVQEAGGKVIIGDSPGGLLTERALRRVYSVTGMEHVAENVGAELAIEMRSETVPNPCGKVMKYLTVSPMVLGVDGIINLPKLKTHGLTIMTGAVKNMFGAIPGAKKAEFHLNMSRITDFAGMLVDIACFLRPRLTVMDAIIGMEGEGPTAGRPREIGALICGADPFAVDVVAATLIGLTDPAKVPTIAVGKARGRVATVDEVDLAGPVLDFNLDALVLRDFVLPRTAENPRMLGKRLPGALQDLAIRYFRPRPVFLHERCTGCGECASNCPPQAIALMDKRPRADLAKCIRCFCCQELCSHKAVEVGRSWLVRRLFG